MTSTSLKKRFTFKFAGNFVALLLSLLAMAFVSRALGPANFGRFEFSTTSFRLIFDTLTLQVPVAYFNWISRKGHKEDVNVTTGLTIYFSAGIAILFACFLLIANLLHLDVLLWPDTGVRYLWFALAFTVAMFFYQLFIFLSDGMSLTVGLEKIRLVQNVIKTVIFLALVWLGAMTLGSYFVSQIILISIVIVISFMWLKHRGACSYDLFKFWKFPREEIKRYTTFLKEYVKPLTILMFFGFMFNYFDRWFLQLIGGSVQQGYFGLSDKMGAIAFIFTSAMTPLLAREFAYAHEENNNERLVSLFGKIRIFLFVTAVISCFMSVQSGAIVEIVGGDKFRGAIIPISIMAFFPIHQTFGQLSGSYLMATGQTKLYSKIGVIAMVASFPITYILLAPLSFHLPGLSLGATGLAIKLVAVQFVATNIQLYFNSRHLGVSYLGWLKTQFVIIFSVWGLAFASYSIANMIYGEGFKSFNIFNGVSPEVFTQIFKCGISGVIYVLMLLILLFVYPQIAGLPRNNASLSRLITSLRQVKEAA